MATARGHSSGQAENYGLCETAAVTARTWWCQRGRTCGLWEGGESGVVSRRAGVWAACGRRVGVRAGQAGRRADKRKSEPKEPGKEQCGQSGSDWRQKARSEVTMGGVAEICDLEWKVTWLVSWAGDATRDDAVQQSCALCAVQCRQAGRRAKLSVPHGRRGSSLRFVVPWIAPSMESGRVRWAGVRPTMTVGMAGHARTPHVDGARCLGCMEAQWGVGEAAVCCVNAALAGSERANGTLYRPRFTAGNRHIVSH